MAYNSPIRVLGRGNGALLPEDGTSIAGTAITGVAGSALCNRQRQKPGTRSRADRESRRGKGVNFYSIEREIGLGKEMALETERQAKMVDDSVVTEYVNRLVQTVANNSDAKVPFTIKVVDSDEVN